MKFPIFTLHEGTVTYTTYRIVVWALFAAFLILLPFNVFSFILDMPDFRLGQLNHALGLMVGVLGLNLILGYSGILHVGQSFFIGLGGYITAILVADFGDTGWIFWEYWTTIPMVVVACFGVGFLLGIPALRIKGLYLALVTLSLAVVFPVLLKMDVTIPFLKGGDLTVIDYTGGANGKLVRTDIHPPSWTGITNEKIYIYFLCLIVTVVMFLMASNMIKSRAGRSIIAIRDNETGAAVSGVNLAMTKTITFGVASVYGGISGFLFILEFQFISDTSVALNLAILLLAGLIVGGVGSIQGAVPAGLLMVFVPWLSSDWGDGPWGQVIFGVALIVLTFVMPGGIVAGVRKLKSYVVQVVPKPPEVPEGLRAAVAAGQTPAEAGA